MKITHDAQQFIYAAADVAQETPRSHRNQIRRAATKNKPAEAPAPTGFYYFK